MRKACHLIMGLMVIVSAMHNTSLFFISESDSKCELVPTHLQEQYMWLGTYIRQLVSSAIIVKLVSM
jgi:hypothetical protein